MVPDQHLGTTERFLSILEIVPLHQFAGIESGPVALFCRRKKLEDSFFADLYVIHVGVWALAFVRQVAQVLPSKDRLELGV